MAEYTWRLLDTHGGIYQIVSGDSNPHRMRVEIHRYEDGAKVAALFVSAGNAYARAEAARLYAQLLDTIGDLEMSSDEPLDIEEPQLVDNKVIVSGPDALTCVACFFGDSVAESIL